MCVLGMDITAPPVPGSVASYTFNLQPGRSQSLRAMSVFAPPSSMQAMNKTQLLTCLSSPPGPKKKSPERPFALKSPELLTTNGCKHLQRAVPLQHTNDWMHDGGPGPGRKEKGGGVRYFRYLMASMAGMQ